MKEYETNPEKIKAFASHALDQLEVYNKGKKDMLDEIEMITNDGLEEIRKLDEEIKHATERFKKEMNNTRYRDLFQQS